MDPSAPLIEIPSIATLVAGLALGLSLLYHWAPTLLVLELSSPLSSQPSLGSHAERGRRRWDALEKLADVYHLLPEVAKKASSGLALFLPENSVFPSKWHMEQVLPKIHNPLSLPGLPFFTCGFAIPIALPLTPHTRSHLQACHSPWCLAWEMEVYCCPRKLPLEIWGAVAHLGTAEGLLENGHVWISVGGKSAKWRLCV